MHSTRSGPTVYQPWRRSAVTAVLHVASSHPVWRRIGHGQCGGKPSLTEGVTWSNYMAYACRQSPVCRPVRACRVSLGAPVRGAAAAPLALRCSTLPALRRGPGDGDQRESGDPPAQLRGQQCDRRRQCSPPRSSPRSRAGSPAPSSFGRWASARSDTSTSRNSAGTSCGSTSSIAGAATPTSRSTPRSGARAAERVHHVQDRGRRADQGTIARRCSASTRSPARSRRVIHVDLPLRAGDPFNRYVMQVYRRHDHPSAP